MRLIQDPGDFNDWHALKRRLAYLSKLDGRSWWPESYDSLKYQNLWVRGAGWTKYRLTKMLPTAANRAIVEWEIANLEATRGSSA